jgi:hypothetical protein
MESLRPERVVVISQLGTGNQRMTDLGSVRHDHAETCKQCVLVNGSRVRNHAFIQIMADIGTRLRIRTQRHYEQNIRIQAMFNAPRYIISHPPGCCFSGDNV